MGKGLYFVGLIVSILTGLLTYVYFDPLYQCSSLLSHHHIVMKLHPQIGILKESDRLGTEVRIFCWILTHPASHEKKARHVKATWGKRCNKLIFISSQNDSSLPAIAFPGIKEGSKSLWKKTRAALKYVYDNHQDDADWFLKADDDTYAVMENMRNMLSLYDPMSEVWFGSRFKIDSKIIYMSGGAGYILSKATLRKFVEVALPDQKMCEMYLNTNSEDVEIGKCLDNIGVLAGDSRDSLGRGRMFHFPPHTNLMKMPKWYTDKIYYKQDIGLNCCSDTAISFHKVDPIRMYELEYLIYHINPYVHKQAELPPDHTSIPKKTLDKYL